MSDEEEIVVDADGNYLFQGVAPPETLGMDTADLSVFQGVATIETLGGDGWEASVSLGTANPESLGRSPWARVHSGTISCLLFWEGTLVASGWE
eukprot:5001608-Pyramimonas_sp.AAC.1